MTTQSPNQQDLEKLCDNYVQHIVDGLDIKSMEQMCYELLMDSYEKCTWDELTEEIVNLYDEDILINLLPPGEGDN